MRKDVALVVEPVCDGASLAAFVVILEVDAQRDLMAPPVFWEV